MTGSGDTMREPNREPTQSERLIGYANEAEKLFSTPDGEAHATVSVEDHVETWPLRCRRFKQWLLRQFYEEQGKAPSAQALADALLPPKHAQSSMVQKAPSTFA